jgi:predicted esterase
LPHSRIVAPLVLAGQFLGTLNGKVAALEAFSATLARSKKPAEVECLADFQHAIEYLKTSGRKLSAAAGGDAQQRALAAKEGLTNPAPVVDGMRKVLAQAEETMRRLKAGQDPYAGRTGDLRRAFRSDVSGELQVYRVYVPSGYAKAEKVPLLLMLHGGGDENSFPDLDGGKLLEMLDQRGYLMVSPRGQLRLNPNFLSDNRQLIELTRQHYPKIDPSRIYCTGLSAGGFGTYTMATTYPDLFAAICCVSGTGDAALADKLKTVPTLIFQGGLDAVVPPAGARKVAARMKELGETVDLRIFPAYGHDYRGPEYLKLSLDFFDRYARK